MEEVAAVGFCAEAGVEDGDDAAVGAAADEAADSLFERDDGLGDAVIEEGFAAIFVDEARAGGDDRVRGDGEGELVDDDAGELIALDVDALPKARGGEKDGVGRFAKFVEQAGL